MAVWMGGIKKPVTKVNENLVTGNMVLNGPRPSGINLFYLRRSAACRLLSALLYDVLQMVW